MRSNLLKYLFIASDLLRLPYNVQDYLFFTFVRVRGKEKTEFKDFYSMYLQKRFIEHIAWKVFMGAVVGIILGNILFSVGVYPKMWQFWAVCLLVLACGVLS